MDQVLGRWRLLRGSQATKLTVAAKTVTIILRRPRPRADPEAHLPGLCEVHTVVTDSVFPTGSFVAVSPMRFISIIGADVLCWAPGILGGVSPGFLSLGSRLLWLAAGQRHLSECSSVQAARREHAACRPQRAAGRLMRRPQMGLPRARSPSAACCLA